LGTHEAAFYLLMNDEVMISLDAKMIRYEELGKIKESVAEQSLVAQIIDGILVAFYLTMDRVERFDYSASAWSEGFSFVAPRPGEENRLFAFIGPFQPTVS